MKKPGTHMRDRGELEKALKVFAKDMEKVGKYIKTAERAIAANVSRHISS